jgi:hypothetical protein
MDSLSTLAICSIVTAVSVFVFLLSLEIALLLRPVTGVREPLALVIVATGVIGGYFTSRAMSMGTSVGT